MFCGCWNENSRNLRSIIKSSDSLHFENYNWGDSTDFSDILTTEHKLLFISVIYEDVKILYNQRKCVENHSSHMRAQQFAHETTFSSKARAQCLPPCSVRLNRHQEALYPSPTFFFYHNYTFSVKLTHMFKKRKRKNSNYYNFATYPSWLHLLRYWSILSGEKRKHLPFLCLSEASKYPTMTAEREMGKTMCRL